MKTSKPLNRPLDDLTVIEFASNVAAPVAGMLMADFGARVIKVEAPSGDATRSWGTSRFGGGEFTGTYLSVNRNKEGMVLDLTSESGRKVARALIKSADVVLHSYLPRVAKKLQLDYKSIYEQNERVVYCSVSGFGSKGPLAGRPGFDMLLQAYAGHMSITGEPGRPAVRSGPSSIDLLTGAHAAFGIMVALKERERSGLGQEVEVSLLGSALHMMGNHLADFSGSGNQPGKFGGQFPNMAPYGVYRGNNREFFLGISSDAMWQRFCRETEIERIVDDERFSTNRARLSNRADLDGLLLPVLARRTAEDWIELCGQLSIPASLVYAVDEVLRHEQATSNEMLVPTGIDGVVVTGVPLTLSRTPGVIRSNAPRLGQDTRQVLEALGLYEAEK